MTPSPRSARDDRLVDLLAANPDADRADVLDWVRSADPMADTVTASRIVERVTARARGLGVIERFLEDGAISEVMINGPGPVYLDRGRCLEESGLVVDEHDLGLLIERILDPLGLRVDRSSPLVDARLADGSRVNIIVPPLAIDGPVLTIRRFAADPVPLDRFGDDEVVGLVTELVAARASILVVGATAAGKTSLLNAIGGLLDPAERVITIEDTAELRLPGSHVVRLEARRPNSEGVGEVSLRHLVRNALRMRPDRLVIGEVRGPEALDLVLALSTGHRGSLATCHAGDPIGALRRLETLVLLGDADLPIAAIRDQIATAIDIIVHVERVGPVRLIREVVALAGPGAVDSLWRLGPGAISDHVGDHGEGADR